MPEAQVRNACDAASLDCALGLLPRPGVLLDRDGTIIVDYGYVGSVDRVELIEGALESASAVYLGAETIDRPGVWAFPSLAASANFILERIAA